MAGAEVPSLNTYMLQCQRFIADTSQTFVNPEDMVNYINRARREVAMRSQCIRRKPPVQGQITRIEITDSGQGYANPQVHIDPPDSPSGEQPYPGGAQAEAIAQQIGGQVSDISVNFGGDGYFRPRIRIFDEGGPGEGAEAVAVTTPLTVTQGFQEVYPFKAFPVSSFPGVAEIFAVRSISFIYANFRYSIPVYDFTKYQSYVRIYPQQFLFVPTAAAQFGQGVGGSLYMYPIPSDMYQFEVDAYCLPQDMEDDTDFEALEKPWVDAVPYFAAHLAYMGLQNHNAGQYMLNLYDDMCHRYSAYARIGRQVNPYGRWSAFT